jgi:hypothetical protein
LQGHSQSRRRPMQMLLSQPSSTPMALLSTLRAAHTSTAWWQALQLTAQVTRAQVSTSLAGHASTLSVDL